MTEIPIAYFPMTSRSTQTVLRLIRREFGKGEGFCFRMVTVR